MQLPLATVALAAFLALASAQRFTGPNPNTVDEYDYEDAGSHLRAQPQARSYAPNQARLAAAQPRPTPVPILKQINRHNDDGSYTYGYEGADGSFKIETKLVTGEVMGKYGYVDDTGKVRVVEYGANKYGFQPAGEGITVAPPTLVDETRIPKQGRPSALSGSLNAAGPSQESQEDIYDDSQYYEEATPAPLRPAPVRALRPQAAPRPRAQQAPQQYFENAYTAPAAAPARQSAIPNNFAQFTQSTNFGSSTGLAAPRPLPAPRFSSALGPVPSRAQISGAAPAGPVYRSFSPAPAHAPAPVSEPQPSAPQPQALFVPQSQLPGLSQHYSPAAPVYQPRRPAPNGGGGLLDQLARDYALPQNAAQPLVDTSFGVY